MNRFAAAGPFSGVYITVGYVGDRPTECVDVKEWGSTHVWCMIRELMQGEKYRF